VSNRKTKESNCFQTQKLIKREVEAIKALNNGDASEYQQKLALAVIVNKFCRSQDLLYIPNSSDETSFLNGRGFVGQKILKIINVPIGKLINEEETEDNE